MFICRGGRHGSDQSCRAACGRRLRIRRRRKNLSRVNNGLLVDDGIGRGLEEEGHCHWSGKRGHRELLERCRRTRSKRNAAVTLNDVRHSESRSHRWPWMTLLDAAVGIRRSWRATQRKKLSHSGDGRHRSCRKTSHQYAWIRVEKSKNSNDGHRKSGTLLPSSPLITPLEENNAGILEPHELRKVSHEKERISYDGAIVSEIDSIVKKHADTLLHALEGLSSRLSQIESRTRHLENSVDEMMVTVGNNNGSTDGKLGQLENVLREVQTGVQVLLDKQEIVESQLQLAKLQGSKSENKQPEDVSTVHSEVKQQQGHPPQLIQQPYQPPVTPVQPIVHPVLPAQRAAPPPPPQQSQPQFPPQLPQQHTPSVPSLPREAYFPSQNQATDVAHQQYQTPVQQPQQQLPPPPQHYQSAPQIPQYPQPSQSQHVNLAPQLQPPAPEESAPYMPPPYPPSIRQPAPPFPQASGGPPPQQFFGANSTIYEPPANKPSSGQTPYSSGYGPPMGPGFSEAYPYSGSPSRHSSSAMKPSPFSSSAPSSGSGNYPRLPTAQILPQALPTASSSSGSSGTKVPIDDVVEKVATMGFSREQVRATVRKLTDNGQSVDLNVVLDKLMNDGEIQPQKGWFGR